MKKMILVFAAILALGAVGLTEATPSPAEAFLENVGKTWDSFLVLADSTVQDVTAWSEGIASDVSGWIDTVSAGIQQFIAEHKPEVEKWLKEASQEVRQAWSTVTNQSAYSREEVIRAYETLLQWLTSRGVSLDQLFPSATPQP